MLENPLICDGGLNTNAILSQWQEVARERNFGAVVIFIGVVRDENGISALSFDIYIPLLKSWLDSWQIRAKSIEKDLNIMMAHSKGDVKIGECSFMCGILSRNRKAALAIYDEFIEDFKANAPIWKYDIKDGVRIYAQDRSKKLRGAGILEWQKAKYDKNH